MTGIICPSIFEYRYIKSMRLDPKKAVLTLSGMGKVRALHACHELVRKHPGIRRLLLVGYAGGLSGLSVGDRIEPDIFIEQDYDARPFEPFPNRIRFASKPLLPGSKRAAMLTQDRFLTENPFKGTALSRKHPRLACDMEAYAVAYFCRQRNMPFAALKFISDSADGSADHDFLKACRRLAPALKKAVKQAVNKGGRS
jgi:adenosylhomocysteine nucleosidase